jgi:hypothetical protein
MKKCIFSGVALFVIAVIAAFNVSLDTKNNNDWSMVSLANVDMLAQAETRAENCPGGYCDYSNSWGDECSACCPGGKNPKCNSSGCGCS